MGLYIKGMEMPKKSGQYVLYLDVYGDPPAAPPDVHMADCVRYFVFEVPELHGRLIDADKLDIYQRAEAAYVEYQEDEDNFYLEGMAMGLCEAVKQLSAARTIIPASVEIKT